MTEQKNDNQAASASAEKLVLPVGTLESAAIEVSEITGVHVVKGASGWVLEIHLAGGRKVEVRYTPENLKALSAYAKIWYPEGEPEMEPMESAPEMNPTEAAPETALEAAHSVSGDDAKKEIELIEFSKLGKAQLDKVLASDPVGKIPGPGPGGKKSKPT